MNNRWTDDRLDDFVKRYEQDREKDEERWDRIESKLDKRQLSPAMALAAFVPLSVGVMTSIAMVLSRGGS